jgi:hypothetical protein
MGGLRLYVDAPSTEPASNLGIEENDLTGNRVFYSRRGKGPIYRWLYEDKLAHWRVSRMHTSDFDAHKLSNATWKSVPETLQAQLGSHYLD